MVSDDVQILHRKKTAKINVKNFAVDNNVYGRYDLWSVLVTRMSRLHVSTLASFYSIPHWKGQAEEEHFCLSHIQQLRRTKARFCTVGSSCSDRLRHVWYRFAGRTKDWCFQAFVSYDDEILDAVAMLRNDNDLPSDACSQLERFDYVLYRSNIHTTVRVSMVPLLKSCSRRRKPSINFCFTELTYSACTLHSHDLEES